MSSVRVRISTELAESLAALPGSPGESLSSRVERLCRDGVVDAASALAERDPERARALLAPLAWQVAP